MKQKIIAQVHRFHDKVALYVGANTVYLSREDAQKLGNALAECAFDIRNNAFVHSTFHTTEIEIGEGK